MNIVSIYPSRYWWQKQEVIMPSIVEYDQYYNPVTGKWHELCDGRKRIWSYLHDCKLEEPEGKMYKLISKDQADIASSCRVDRSLVRRFLQNLTKCGYIKTSANSLHTGQKIKNTYSILKPLVVRKNPYWESIMLC